MIARPQKVQKLVECAKACGPNMTLRQIALLALTGTKTTTVREAAHMLGVSKPVVTRGTYALIREGLVTKTVSDEDRRVVFISITDEGRQFLNRLPF